MNKKLYNQTLNKIKMSQECEERILDAAFNHEAKFISKQSHKKVKFIPLIASAAVLLTCGTWVAAESGNLDWIYSIFKSDSREEVSEYTKDLIGKMENFSFESTNDNISFTPVGMIADEQNLYCVVKPEGINPEQIELIDLISDSFDYNSGISFVSGPNREDNSENLVLTYNLCEQQFNDGCEINIYLSTDELFSQNSLKNTDVQNIIDDIHRGKDLNLKSNAENVEADIFKISFTIDFGEFNTLHEDYINYSGKNEYKISELVITPLSATIYSNGYSIYNNELKIIMNNGNIITSEPQSGGGSYSVYDQTPHHHAQWYFDEPIKPDDISQVYLRDVLIYEN